MPRNVAEFHIIGQVANVDDRDKVVFVNVAANYNRQVDGEWTEDTHWNRVTCFGKQIDRARESGKGDMVRITGRVRQTQFEREGEVIYGVDLIADSYSILNRAG